MGPSWPCWARERRENEGPGLLESPWGLFNPSASPVNSPWEHTDSAPSLHVPFLVSVSHSHGRSGLPSRLLLLPLPTSNPAIFSKQKSAHFASLLKNPPAAFCHPKSKIPNLPGTPKPYVPRPPPCPAPRRWDLSSAHSSTELVLPQDSRRVVFSLWNVLPPALWVAAHFLSFDFSCHLF